MNRLSSAVLLVSCLIAAPLFAADAWRAPSKSQIDAIYPQVESLYMDLHRNPELSLHEEKTAVKIADQLRRLGFEVTTGVGGTGVVGVLKNGAGPTVMIRAELDALPVLEKTGLPYASHVTTKNDDGVDVPVMHACGHDLHMAIGIGTARLLAENETSWRGTFIYVGQPAEERVMGAAAMLKDNLFTRFPRPDYAITLHDTPDLPAGKVGYTSGYELANSDALDVTIFGRGGHGARPQLTVDPIVIAARTILAWQTIVSRELDARDPAVITVGSFHGGTKHNIIPDEVHLQLTVRSYKDEVRKHLLESIGRIAKAEAEAAGAGKPPLLQIVESTKAVYNDPALTQRIAATLQQTLGAANVEEMLPIMASDDFSEYGHAGVPAVDFWLGAVEPARFEAAKRSGEILPGLHSALFAPDRGPSLRTGIEAESAAVLALLGNPLNPKP
jgi:hippurate hydrolase